MERVDLNALIHAPVRDGNEPAGGTPVPRGMGVPPMSHQPPHVGCYVRRLRLAHNASSSRVTMVFKIWTRANFLSLPATSVHGAYSVLHRVTNSFTTSL